MIFSGLINIPLNKVAQIPEFMEGPISVNAPEQMGIDEYTQKIKGIVQMDVEEGIVSPGEALQGLGYALNHLRFEFSNEVRRV